MVSAGRTLMALVGALAVACSGSSSSKNMGADAASDARDAANGTRDVATDADGGSAVNVAPVVVDSGPAGVQAVNTLYTTVTLCRPGTNVCQTIDHIEVDTGSIGLRIVSTVLDATLMLPQQKATGGNPLVECYQYADGYNWGPVATADVHLGGEVAAKVPIQIAGGAGSIGVPSDCSSAGTEEDTVMAFGGNGLIGLGFQQADCGANCASTTNPQTGSYYSCTSTACTAASVPIPQQLQNVVGLFPQDNNGVAVRLPAIDPKGAATVTGSLIFGIGTASNNGLGTAQVITIDDVNGYFTTTFGGQSLTASFIDSGSLSYASPDTSIPQCTADALMGFFCPPTNVSLMATNIGLNHVNIVTPFNVAAASGLYASGDAAFDDLAITDFGPGGYFDWGLSFFYGKTIFTAISGAMTPGGRGPYFAY
jgi:Protein of unknown function (DUF3443)